MLAVVFVLGMSGPSCKGLLHYSAYFKSLASHLAYELQPLEDFAQSHGQKARISSVNFVHSSAWLKCKLIGPEFGVDCFNYVEVNINGRVLEVVRAGCVTGLKVATINNLYGD